MSHRPAGSPRFRAGRDGVAHAHRGRDPRALCGAPSVPEQFAWPETSRCADCLALDLWPTTSPTVRRPDRGVLPGGASRAGDRPRAVGPPSGRSEP